MRQTNLFGQTASESATAKTSKQDAYQQITEKIIEAMKQGIVPWQRPWSGGNGVGYVSHSTGRAYSFLNAMLLMMAGKEPGEFITFKQCKEAGGHVKKGAKSTTIYFWKRLYFVEDKKDENGNTILDENGEPEKVEKTPICLKGYSVFALSDTEGVDPKYITSTEDSDDNAPDPVQSAEDIVNAYYQEAGAPALNIMPSDKAFYSPACDSVTVPERKQYNEIAEYYSTLFHETVHSTGHKSRLDRFKTGAAAAFGSNEYSREELVAEIGAAYLVHRSGIECEKAFNNSVAYLQGWIKHLTDKPREFATAAAQAEKAVRWILGERTDNNK